MKKEELIKRIEQELEQQFEHLIKKIQKKKIDPVGFGLYARAYHYKEYKKVEDNWGNALAESDINVSVKIDINSNGSYQVITANDWEGSYILKNQLPHIQNVWQLIFIRKP